jgi:hypothetical protein
MDTLEILVAFSVLNETSEGVSAVSLRNSLPPVTMIPRKGFRDFSETAETFVKKYEVIFEMTLVQ